jgi:tRNA(fMet)-specific endonuclease VapC
MKYLIETSTCIELIRRRPIELVKRMAKLRTRDFALSVITVAELQYGVEKSSQSAQEREALDEFFVPFAILDFDFEATVAYGKVRAALQAAGTPIGSLDMLIAAHAVSRNLILVTRNLKEFKRVPGLKAEDWVKG